MSASSIHACVMHLSVYLGRPVSASALNDAMPDAEAPADHDARLVHDLRRSVIAAERVGLTAFFGRRAVARIGPELLPAILPMRNGGAVVLHERRDSRAVIHDPAMGDGLREIPEEDLWHGWTGHILTLRFDPSRTAAKGESTLGVTGHWFRSALAANRWAYVQVAIAAVVTNVLALVVSLFTMVVYDRILPTASTDSLFALALGVALALVFDLIVKSVRAAFIDQAGHRADLVMGQRIFDHVIGIRQEARSGSVGSVSATMREFETLRDFFTSTTLVALVDLPFMLIFLVAILFLGGQLAIVPALAVPAVLLVGVMVQPALRRLADQMLVEGQTKQAVLIETLTGIETIKVVGASARLRARWAEALSRQSDYAVSSRGFTQLAINLTAFVQQAAQILIVVHGALLVVSGSITSGVLIAAVILAGRALAPLGVIAQTLTRLHQARTSFRSLDALMQTPLERPAGQSWLARPILTGGLTFQDVRFAYPGQRMSALDGVSFTIRPGERVAILGPIGSGKSTVARLILGLYSPDEGVVSADGVDLRQIDPADLRRNIGAVLQEPWLISGTLRENIALGARQPSDAAVLAAAQLAGVEDFAARHPDGYAMQIAERGEGLSGGQRQAVALARALMNDPAILLLDEPTAAMDTASEAKLIARIKPTLAGRTLVIVTHRPSLLDLVERVIVIDGGKVVADGPKAILQRRATGVAK